MCKKQVFCVIKCWTLFLIYSVFTDCIQNVTSSDCSVPLSSCVPP